MYAAARGARAAQRFVFEYFAVAPTLWMFSSATRSFVTEAAGVAAFAKAHVSTGYGRYLRA